MVHQETLEVLIHQKVIVVVMEVVNLILVTLKVAVVVEEPQHRVLMQHRVMVEMVEQEHRIKSLDLTYHTLVVEEVVLELILQHQVIVVDQVELVAVELVEMLHYHNVM
tara:strand:- start:187 stop:513 length:327 start_codon:yes stop_codon:yes gene_type:complete